MTVRNWSATASNNDSAPPNGAPEGQSPGSVNNVIRQIMAEVRDTFEQLPYVDLGHTPTRVDNDTFTVSTDRTATYYAGRRLKLVGATTSYATIASSSYSAPNTTVNVTMDSGNVPTSLVTVSLGFDTANAPTLSTSIKYDQTPAELAAGITPVNVYIPHHLATGGIFLVDRYGTNALPGMTDMAPAINNAFLVAKAARGGEVRCSPLAHGLSSSVFPQSYCKWVGGYGEFSYPSTLPGGGTANSGTELVWNSVAANGKMVDYTNMRMFSQSGIGYYGLGNTTVTAIWLDSNNNPSSSQNKIEDFSIRDCYRGVQWGTSGIAGGSYAIDGTLFSGFTIWSSVANSVGFEVNSGNAGQMSGIEKGGIQVQRLGVDIKIANILRIEQVFGGGQMNEGFIQSSVGIDITIKGCSSECWGVGKSSRTNGAFFLKVVKPVEAYPVVESCITMSGNQINNPIILDYPARIVSSGDNWGFCADFTTGGSVPAIGTASAAPAYSGATAYIASKDCVSSGGINYQCVANTTGNAPPNATYWSPTRGKSRVMAVNNGIEPNSIDITTGPYSGMPTHGWIDGPYINLSLRDPSIGFIQPAYVSTLFTTNGAGGWTVDSGDVEYYGYMLDGKTMTIAFRILTSSVIAAVGNELRIAIPAGKKVSQPMCNGLARMLDNGVLTPGFVICDQGNAYIQVQRQDLANFTASANTTQIKGQLTFMVD